MAIKDSMLRGLFRMARSWFPVIRYKDSVFVFRHEDVVEALKRDQDFLIQPINGENIARHIGPFMLGMDQSPQLEAEHKAMYAVIQREDQVRIRRKVQETAAQLMAEAKEKGRFDLVRDYTRLVPLRMVTDYFGIAGPTEEETLRWNRLIFWDIFLNFKSEPTLRTQALEASAKLNAVIDEVIQVRKAALQAGTRLPNDLVSRLVSAQAGNGPSLDDDGIRRNLAGSLLGAEEPISKVCIFSLGILMQHPKALAMAKEAAAKGDVERVGRIVMDALRFNPSNPAMLRQSAKDLTLGPQGGKKRRVGGNKKVYLLTLSANFDPKAFPKPLEIRDDRPWNPYLHFGYGQHVCWGNHLNFVAIPEMMTLLLQQPIRPVGKLTKEGSFPESWIWEFVGS